ncbi:MAG: antirestriction protein [Legionellales bacterium]
MSDITTDVITSKTVTENKMLAFLPRKLPRHFLQFESCVYYFARNIIIEYSGGQWEFIELSNQGFYMRPLLGGSKVVVEIDGNEFSGLVSEDAVGIIASIFSLNYLLFETQEENLYKHYEALIDYAHLHEEREQIFAAID